MNDTYVIHLSAKRCCMRAVKYRELSLAEIDQVALDANQAVGKDGTNQQYMTEVRRQGIKAMIVAVSAEQLPPEADIQALDEAGKITWEPMTAAKLTADMRWQYETMFRSKDEQILTVAYDELHNVSLVEAQGLVGKSMTSTSKR